LVYLQLQSPLFEVSTPHGEKRKASDYWLVNGQKNWAFVKNPAARELGVPEGTPIRLHEGNERKFGSTHIYKKARRTTVQNVLRRSNKTAKRYSQIAAHETYAPEFVWLKLNSSGSFYSADSEDKSKIHLSMSPGSLMILQIKEDNEDQLYLSIVSLFVYNSNGLDGDRLGRYNSSWVNPDAHKSNP